MTFASYLIIYLAVGCLIAFFLWRIVLKNKVVAKQVAHIGNWPGGWYSWFALTVLLWPLNVMVASAELIRQWRGRK